MDDSLNETQFNTIGALSKGAFWGGISAMTGAGVVSNGNGTTISDTEFTDNNANSGAGAVLNGDDATVENATFTGNEAETLILVAAGTSNAVTASGTVTYVDPVLSGSLPTFGS